MCGICGIRYFDPYRQVDSAVIAAMTAQLVHRGPDDCGSYGNGAVALGVRRLSIIDQAGSHQPLHSEDRAVWLVCNGEIYNYRELRARLSRRHQFASRGDAEVILHLYEDVGAACVRDLRGMFAFALWDAQRDQLLLAVDRFGEKPLYYALDHEKIVFASELKAILKVPGVRREIDPDALDEYLAYGYITAPRTIFRAICKLQPGHCLRVDRSGDCRIDSYWEPRFEPPARQQTGSFAELADALRERLRESVQLRLVSDVPVGAFLSGGVDSSAVVALMSRLSPQRLKTFSIGFEESAYDETPYAAQIARHFDTDHTMAIVRARDARDVLPDLIQQFDEPFADSSMIPTYWLARAARQQVTVALSGDGGDEVFGGYFQHQYAYRQQFLQRLIPTPFHSAAARIAPLLPSWTKVKPYLAALPQPASCWTSRTSFFSPAQRWLLYTDELRAHMSEGAAEKRRLGDFGTLNALDGLSQVQAYDLTHYLPGDILVKVDRAAMLASLEVRSPFLDPLLFEFAASVPASYRVSLRTTKRLLKRALEPLVPAVNLRRKKQGFSIPQSEWLAGTFNPLLRDTLTSPFLSHYFDTGQVQRLVDAHSAGRADHKDRLWALLCLDLWARCYCAA